MSGWVAGAVVGGAVIGAGASIYAGGQAAEASERAAQTQAGAQMEKLEFKTLEIG